MDSNDTDPLMLEFNGLNEQQVSKSKALFSKHNNIFAQGDDDLSCTNLITHKIPLLYDVLVTWSSPPCGHLWHGLWTHLSVSNGETYFCSSSGLC